MRHTLFFVLVYVVLCHSISEAWNAAIAFAKALKANVLQNFGYAQDPKRVWRLTRTATKHPKVWHALRLVGNSLISSDNQLIAVRIGKAVNQVFEVAGYPSLLLIWADGLAECQVSHLTSAACKLQDILLNTYKESIVLQIVRTADEALVFYLMFRKKAENIVCCQLSPIHSHLRNCQLQPPVSQQFQKNAMKTETVYL